MGGQRCVAFGCKSGHKRGLSKEEKAKKEKIYFFQVPKVDTELWQHALIRKDIVIKPGHSVCEKHFLKEDLLWRKELKGPDGQILGVSADYKLPKLRKGALPSMYLGITPDGKPAETSDSYNKKSPVKVNKRRGRVNTNVKKKTNVNVKGNTKANTNVSAKRKSKVKEGNVNISHNVIEENGDISASITEENGNISPDVTKENGDINDSVTEENHIEIKNNGLVDCTLVIPDQIEEISLFEIIFENEKSVALPIGWCRQNMRYNCKRLVHFCQFTPRIEEEIIQPTCAKQVIVNENLETNIFIMRQKIEKEDSTIHVGTLSCLEDLEHLLNTVNSWKICSGLSISGIEAVETSILRKDKEGILRSEKCCLYMQKISRSGCCDECRKNKKIFSRKVSRSKNMTNSPRFGANLSAKQRKKIEEMRLEIKCHRRGRERALARIRILKELRNRDLQAYKASQKGIEQLLNESTLDENQKLVLWEILSTSKQTDSRSRRYSKVWISFCLSLHRKSPVTYRFLRQNNVLPLPSPRTVLRFAQLNPSVDQNISKLDLQATSMKDATAENVTLQDEIIPEEDMPNVEMETEVS